MKPKAKIFRTKQLRLAVTAALCLLGAELTQTAGAADFFWATGACGSGSWDSVCWSPTSGGPATQGPPTDFYPNRVFLENSGAAAVNVTYGSNARTDLQSIQVSASGAGTMSMSQSGGTIAGLVLGVGTNSSYNLSAGSIGGFESVSNIQGTFNETGGDHSVRNMNISGTYNLSGGNMYGDGLVNVSGVVNQTGGVANAFTMGLSGTYNLAGGNLKMGWVSGSVLSGTFNQSGGTSTIGDGGISLTGFYNLSGGTLTNNFVINNSGVLTISGTGMLKGTGTVTGAVAVDNGTIAPGNSPGTLTMSGDLTFDNGTLATEIGADASDLLGVAGAASFHGGTFTFSFLDGFLPAFGSHWHFLSAGGGITGWQGLNLSVTGLDSSYSYYISEANNGLTFNVADAGRGLGIAAIPEPETYAMLLAGLGLLGFAARRRKLSVA